MIDSVFLALLQAVAGAPTAAPQQAPGEQAQQEQTPQQAAAPQEERRCRMERREGSNLRQRVCLTASERDAMHDATSSMLRDVQSQSGRFGKDGLD